MAAAGDNRGELTITFDAAKVGVPTTENTLILTPWVNNGSAKTRLAEALTDGIAGNLDWSCQSTTSAAAVKQIGQAGTLGKLPEKYAPSQCR